MDPVGKQDASFDSFLCATGKKPGSQGVKKPGAKKPGSRCIQYPPQVVTLPACHVASQLAWESTGEWAWAHLGSGLPLLA